LEEVRQTVEAWRIDDHTERPHRALGQQTPAAWEAAWAPALQAPGERFRWTNPGGQVTICEDSQYPWTSFPGQVTIYDKSAAIR
jgi:hypothetical protein